MASRPFHAVAAILPVLFALPRNGHAEWPSDPNVNLPVSSAAGHQVDVASVLDGAGGVIISWGDTRTGTYDIYAQRVKMDGEVDPTWPASGIPLCTAADHQTLPVIVSDGTGGAIVAWQDRRSGTPEDWAIYAQHLLAGGLVDPAWPPNGRALCAAGSAQRNPRIVADGTGGAIVAWEGMRGDPYTTVYAQHVLASGQVDPVWPNNGRNVHSGGKPALVADGAGGAILVWQDCCGVYAQHLLPTGELDPVWPSDGRALGTPSTGYVQTNPAILADGTGGAIVAWQDARSGQNDIYAQHVSANGTLDPGWPSGGRALCVAGGSQDGPAIVADGAGGAIVAWQDARSGSYHGVYINYDVYAQHVWADGTVDPAWPSDGRALCTSVGYAPLPKLVADGIGGAIVALQDNPTTDPADMYFGISAHHVLANGTVDPIWPIDGRAVCTAPREQRNPAIVVDGSGGAIIAWADERSGTNDVYAQRVQANGQLGGGVVSVMDGSHPTLELVRVRPNPAHSGELTLEVFLTSLGSAFVELLDVGGRRVTTREVGWLGLGRHEIILRTGPRLPSGLYFVRLRQGASVRTRRVTLLD